MNERFKFTLHRNDEKYHNSTFPPEIVLENCTAIQLQDFMKCLDDVFMADYYILDSPSEAPAPALEIPDLLNFAGLWKVANGAFVKITSWDEEIQKWHGVIYQEDGAEAGIIYYDRYGNEESGNAFLQLVEKRRGEEGGWPNV